MNYITKQKIKWYISGAFIFDKIKDVWHLATRKDPIWPDADQDQCTFIFCRFCGGKAGKFFKNKQ